LPYKPSSPALADAYDRLMERGRNSVGEVWEKGSFLSLLIALFSPFPRPFLLCAVIDSLPRS
jgi:hypothetical protein